MVGANSYAPLWVIACVIMIIERYPLHVIRFAYQKMDFR